MTDNFEALLDECVSAVQAGVPIEDVLAETPDYAAELRPMLYAAAILTDPDPVIVPEVQKNRLRAEYMRQVATLPKLSTPSMGQRLQALYHIIRRRLTRKAVLSDLLTVTITVILTLSMMLLMLSYAASNTVPGDLLYRFKRVSENVQLTFTPSDEAQQLLSEEFNQRRLVEIERLLDLNRAAIVEFEGVVERKGANLWIIEGYPVIIDDDTTIIGEATEGTMVHVTGFLRTNNTLVADQIELLE